MFLCHVLENYALKIILVQSYSQMKNQFEGQSFSNQKSLNKTNNHI